MADIDLNILAKLNGLNESVRSIEGFVKQSQTQIGKLEKNFKIAGDKANRFLGVAAFGGFVTGVTGAIALAGKFAQSLSEPIRAAIAQENAVNELNTALALSGNFSKKASDDLVKYADELERTTLLQDDAILSTLAYLESLTNLDADGLKRATTAAINFAAVTGKDLRSAAEAVAKSTTGVTTSFQRLGIEIKKGSTDAETFANTLNALDKFQGFAESKTLTFSGSLDQLKKAFENVGESVAENIVKDGQLVAIVNILTESINGLILNSNEAGDRFSIFGFASVALLNVFQALVGVVGTIAVGFTTLGAILLSPSILLGTFISTIQNFIQSGFKLTAVLKTIKQGFADTFDFILGSNVSNFFSDIVNSAEKLKEKIVVGGNEIERAAQKQSEELNKLGEVAKATNQKQINALEELEAKFKDSGKTQVEIIKRNSLEQIQIIRDTIEKNVALQERGEKLIKSIKLEAAIKTSEELDKIAKKQEDNQRKRADELQKQQTTQSGQIGAVGNLVTSLGGGASALLEAFANLAAQLVDSLDPIVGALIKVGKQLFDFFSQSPEAFREAILNTIKSIPDSLRNIATNLKFLVTEAVTAFIDSVPEIISAFFDLLFTLPTLAPLFIETLIDNAPKIVDSLSTAILKSLQNQALITGFVVSFSLAAPRIALAFALAIFQTLSNPAFWLSIGQVFIQSLVAGLVGLLGPIGPILIKFFRDGGIEIIAGMARASLEFSLSLIQGAISFIGTIIQGAGAFVQSIIDQVNGALESINPFSNGGGGGGGGGGGRDIFDLLPKFAQGGLIPSLPSTANDNAIVRVSGGEQVLSQDLTRELSEFLRTQGVGGGSGQMLTVNLVLGQSELASVILDLNRQGFRTK